MYFSSFLVMLTSYDVEHSGVEDGGTDQSQEDKATGKRLDEDDMNELILKLRVKSYGATLSKAE